MHSDISLLKVVKSMCFAGNMFIYLGNFTVFHAKVSFWATLLKDIHKISLISPQKSVYFMFCFILCLTFVILLHKIKFYAFCMFA